jgi:hypothetical protein
MKNYHITTKQKMSATINEPSTVDGNTIFRTAFGESRNLQ